MKLKINLQKRRIILEIQYRFQLKNRFEPSQLQHWYQLHYRLQADHGSIPKRYGPICIHSSNHVLPP